MASVTFSPAIGGDGSTITDDTDPFTGLDGGGHRARFVPALEQMVAVAEHIASSAETVNEGAAVAVEAVAAAAASAAAAEGDRIATAADRVQTGLDAAATGADRVQTGLDRIATAADRVQTGLDAAAASDSAAAAEIAAAASLTHSQVSATERQYATMARDDAEVFADATAADRTQTGLDAQATAADRVQTGLDAAAAAQSAADALTSEQAAAVSAAIVGPPTLPTMVNSAAMAPGVVVESAAVTVSGSASTVWPAVVRGDGTPEVQVNAGPWAQSAIFRSGDTVRLRNTSPPDGLNYVATLYAHSFSAPWSLVPLPVTLFAAGEQGAWYDPSDFATMFQDAAGATPVTTLEQPVGRILDKSGRGNHATQSTATARPVLSARYNFLTKTEQFDDAVWLKSGASVTTNVIASPEDTLTADKVIPSATNSTHFVWSIPGGGYGSGYAATVYAKAGEHYKIGLSENLNTAQGSAIVDLRDGSQLASAAQSGTTVVTSVGNGWYRITWTPPFAVLPNNPLGVYVVPNTAPAGWYIWQTAWVGDGTSGLYIWGASITPTSQSGLPYQRVNTATDYDADPTKFKPYLRFDGVDDFLVTSTITPGTDKAQAFMGASGSGTGVLVESGPNFNPRGIAIYRNPDTSYSLQGHNGSGFMGYVTSPISNNAPKILAMGYDIGASGGRAAEALFSRVNGVTDRPAEEGSWAEGVGNFAPNAIYIGRRGGTSSAFNGRLYSMIVRFGANMAADQITQTENWVANKTGVTI